MMKLKLLCLTAVIFHCLASSAWASDAALKNCRLEKTADKRLACYDAILVTPTSASAVTPVPQPVPVPLPAPVPTAPQASSFGKPSTTAAQDAVESTIPGRFEGWYPKTRIKLANGQVWQVEDSSTAALSMDSPQVRVRRGFAGSFYLEIAGTNRSPRVRRVD